MAKIKFINDVEILSSKFSMVWDKTTDSGSFSWTDSKITVGIKSYSKDPLYTMQIF